MSEFKGSFLGFTYDGIHSSDLGIVRTDNGGRYNENLFPDVQDKTVQIPGADGTYYYGSYYTKRAFNIPIAFDNLTDKQIRNIRKLFGEKGIHKIIFDENPYKVYMVKTTGSPNLKYIAFDADEQSYEPYHIEDLYNGISDDYYEGAPFKYSQKRIYKGEGTLNFIAYNPYAKSVNKYREYYTLNNLGNINGFVNYLQIHNSDVAEWLDSLDLLPSTFTKKISNYTYTLDKVENNHCLIYNPGDLETPFIYKIILNNNNKLIPSISISLNDNNLNINTFNINNSDAGIQINTKLHLIEGIDASGKPTGTVYNQYISSGDFYKIPISEKPILMNITSVSNATTSLEYDYLYY